MHLPYLFSMCVYIYPGPYPVCVCEERDREGKVLTLIFLYQIKNVLLEENSLSNYDVYKIILK